MTAFHGFELLRERALPELDSTARLYRHAKTGAELLSIVNGDENKVFGVTFRTVPNDSTGIAHILEHSVLCGSRKYPVKDPFVQLMKGSLNTFLNAFTYPDKTCYPVASQNLQDFYNLIDVYLDAVFHPRITPHTLEQEGWHYELDAIDAPLTCKGVVFNEMKGNYSSPDSLLSDWSQRSLFPDTAYGVDYGGDPKHIPELSYTDFKAFHERNYHPSAARLFFYGDDDPDERLRLLDARLSVFEPIKVDGMVALQSRFPAPRKLARTYAAGEVEPDARKAMVTVNWMLDEISDIETGLGLTVLQQVLVGNHASPLYKALIDSGLGEDITGRGIDDELRQVTFSIGLKNIDPSNTDKVEALILDTLRQLAHQGIDPMTVEAAMNTVEFALREQNTGGFPRGIAVMLTALKSWLYGGDPLARLAFGSPLSAIKARLAAKARYFEGLISRYLLDNPHRTTVVLMPDPEQGEREIAEECARLAKVRAGMSEAELRAVLENTQTLKRLQETPDSPEALATIPSLTLADLPRRNKLIPIEVGEVKQTRVLRHDLLTSGIVYLDVGFDLHALPSELLPYVPLFSRALLETGVGRQDFVQLSQRIGRATGGIAPLKWTSSIRGSKVGAAWLFLRGKAMSDKVGELLDILRDVLLTARIDNRARLEQMVSDEKANLEARLVPGGSGFAGARLRASLNEADWAAEQMSGISYLFFLRKLAETVESDWPSVEAALERMRRILVNRATMLCNLTADTATLKRVEPKLAAFLDALPCFAAAQRSWQVREGPRGEGLTIPAQVNYVAKGADLHRLGFKPSGATHVVRGYLSTSWLWEKVRVQGGAYGGFCSFDPRSGVFSFGSYRDPNLLETLDIYDRSAAFLCERNLDEAELTRSIIGTIGEVDDYMLPDAKGFASMLQFLVCETDEMRQRIREEILAASRADFREFADVLAQVATYGRVVVLGSEQAIEAANAKQTNLLAVTKVM
jgi:Zn-dependent M16 (insulinase) family peptidase